MMPPVDRPSRLTVELHPCWVLCHDPLTNDDIQVKSKSKKLKYESERIRKSGTRGADFSSISLFLVFLSRRRVERKVSFHTLKFPLLYPTSICLPGTWRGRECGRGNKLCIRRDISNLSSSILSLLRVLFLKRIILLV